MPKEINHYKRMIFVMISFKIVWSISSFGIFLFSNVLFIQERKSSKFINTNLWYNSTSSRSLFEDLLLRFFFHLWQVFHSANSYYNQFLFAKQLNWETNCIYKIHMCYSTKWFSLAALIHLIFFTTYWTVYMAHFFKIYLVFHRKETNHYTEKKTIFKRHRVTKIYECHRKIDNQKRNRQVDLLNIQK